MDLEKQGELVKAISAKYDRDVLSEQARRSTELCVALREIQEYLRSSEDSLDVNTYSPWFDESVVDGKRMATRVVCFTEDCGEEASLYGVQVGVCNELGSIDEFEPTFEAYDVTIQFDHEPAEMRNPTLALGFGSDAENVSFGTPLWDEVAYTVQRGVDFVTRAGNPV